MPSACTQVLGHMVLMVLAELELGIILLHMPHKQFLGYSLPVEHGSVTLSAAATATAASAAVPPRCSIRMPACAGHVRSMFAQHPYPCLLHICKALVEQIGPPHKSKCLKLLVHWHWQLAILLYLCCQRLRARHHSACPHDWRATGDKGQRGVILALLHV